MVSNPFIKESSIIFQKDISTKSLVRKYKVGLNIDVKYLLESHDKISLYKCQKSGYLFYMPFSVAGDSNFYQKLQKYDWYYMPWKWEHSNSLNYINEDTKLLEIGSGQGAFLENICSQYKNINCVGLEINQSTVFNTEKYKIIDSTIEQHSLTNGDVYDIVCSFQVLEHITNVDDFLKASIRCLKLNGLLILSVPNNDSFIKYEKQSILNRPPHHMGHWNEKSLRTIGKYNNLELIDVSYEPLQEYHFDFYLNVMLGRFLGSLGSRMILKFLNFCKLTTFVKKFIAKRAAKIKGHSIMIVFKKLI